MNIKQHSIAIYTLIRREVVRIFRIWVQAFLGPITNLFLYFIIFGNIVGQRIGLIDGIPYIDFISPGLILIAAINTSYMHTTSSFFIVRFQKNIEEMLISPLSNFHILVGFVIGAIIRALLVTTIITLFITTFCKVKLHFSMQLLVDLILTCTIFSLAGFLNAIFAKDFDDIALVPSFILTPLGYLGGVFYNIQMLPHTWQEIAKYNPLYFMISTFRAHALDIPYAQTGTTLGIMVALAVTLIWANFVVMNRGLLIRN
ncbi:MAG: ABC transporter permease [Gammaproteobacteria bacterium]|nr:ABC transporter permease [Gammaproteobacteria bacterium]